MNCSLRINEHGNSFYLLPIKFLRMHLFLINLIIVSFLAHMAHPDAILTNLVQVAKATVTVQV